MVTDSLVAGTNVTAAGGIWGGLAAAFFPQLGRNNQMRDSGRNKIGRMMGGAENAQTDVRTRLFMTRDFKTGMILKFPYW
jgi:hypothetical protein